ncbi:methylated-DNA--protein-cysteine methyltransferase [Marmoricola endophyticus]|uniref:Methylated-DNA--protein-cysteine methyltransferase n=1 Tax=Marmoricola endophyticus TaxID=2040280 RepID=A0A917F2T5_9ACTN|nr:methylated-DNA--[protein]-cysteine S-methyltransferase [Marmoricola endophyticus]GGF39285.1 methylated-DNA--protein-cysteine methyltransferase [Marmoricola endophyticus]
MWTSVDSPVGPLRVVTSPGAGEAVAAIEFDPWTNAVGRPVGDRADGYGVLGRAREQLDAYFAGTLDAFDLPLAAGGTAFQERVWAALARIPFGETTSYGALALTLGLTGHGARAVGLANGRNPIPVVVPCHRVVGADGRLTGYAGGLDRKQWLLAHEQHALF